MSIISEDSYSIFRCG